MPFSLQTVSNVFALLTGAIACCKLLLCYLLFWNDLTH